MLFREENIDLNDNNIARRIEEMYIMAVMSQNLILILKRYHGFSL